MTVAQQCSQYLSSQQSSQQFMNLDSANWMHVPGAEQDDIRAFMYIVQDTQSMLQTCQSALSNFFNPSADEMKANNDVDDDGFVNVPVFPRTVSYCSGGQDGDKMAEDSTFGGDSKEKLWRLDRNGVLGLYCYLISLVRQWASDSRSGFAGPVSLGAMVPICIEQLWFISCSLEQNIDRDLLLRSIVLSLSVLAELVETIGDEIEIDVVGSVLEWLCNNMNGSDHSALKLVSKLIEPFDIAGDGSSSLVDVQQCIYKILKTEREITNEQCAENSINWYEMCSGIMNSEEFALFKASLQEAIVRVLTISCPNTTNRCRTEPEVDLIDIVKKWIQLPIKHAIADNIVAHFKQRKITFKPIGFAHTENEKRIKVSLRDDDDDDPFIDQLASLLDSDESCLSYLIYTKLSMHSRAESSLRSFIHALLESRPVWTEQHNAWIDAIIGSVNLNSISSSVWNELTQAMLEFSSVDYIVSSGFLGLLVFKCTLQSLAPNLLYDVVDVKNLLICSCSSIHSVHDLACQRLEETFKSALEKVIQDSSIECYSALAEFEFVGCALMWNLTVGITDDSKIIYETNSTEPLDFHLGTHKLEQLVELCSREHPEQVRVMSCRIMFNFLRHASSLDESKFLFSCFWNLLNSSSPRIRSAAKSCFAELIRCDGKKLIDDWLVCLSNRVRQIIERPEVDTNSANIDFCGPVMCMVDLVELVKNSLSQEDLCNIASHMIPISLYFDDELCSAYCFSKIQSIFKKCESSKILRYQWKAVLRCCGFKAKNMNESILKTLSRLFTEKNHIVWLSGLAQHVIPRLIVMNADAPAETDSLQCLASALKVSQFNLLVNNAHHILAYIFLNMCSQEETAQKAIMKLLALLSSQSKENNAKISIHQLISSCLQNLVTLLCYGLGDERKQVSDRALKTLEFCFEVASDSRDKKVKCESFTKFMLHFYLPALHHLTNNYIVKEDVCIADAQKALRALNRMIELIGVEIDSVITQVLNTLQAAQKREFLRSLCLESWKTLSYSMNEQQLASMLQIIVSHLLCFLEYDDRYLWEVGNILSNILYMNNGVAVERRLSKIFFLPRIDHFVKINEHVDKFLPQDPIKRLSLYAKGASNDDLTIVHASLKKILEIPQNVLSSFLLQDKVDNLFSELTLILLKLSQRLLDSSDSSLEKSVLIYCGKCLGHLGAMDPSRLNMVPKSIAIDVKYKWMVDNFEDSNRVLTLASMMIENTLVPAFRAASDTRSQDRVAFVIQEILKTVGFTVKIHQLSHKLPTKDDESYPKITKWLNFPKTTKDIIVPFLSSSYIINFAPFETGAKPFYSNTKTFVDWIQRWTADLLDNLPQIEAKNFFNCFRAVLRGKFANTAIVSQILPSLVMNELIYGSSERKLFLLNETMAILRNEGKEALGSERRVMCSQQVFKIIDHLADWVRLRSIIVERKKAASARNKTSYDDNREKRLIKLVEDFLRDIPENLLADAAFECKSYARALRHLEAHVRHQQNLGKNPNELVPSFERMIHLHSLLDEIDGMSGLSTILYKYGQNASLDRRILEHTQSGNWAAAQSCFEVGLQMDPGNATYQAGVMECLQNLGHIETMSSYVKHLGSNNGTGLVCGYEQKLAARLNNWDLLEDEMGQSKTKSFDGYLSRLLYDLHLKNNEKFHVDLQDTLAFTTTGLARAGMESYQRSYENMIELHIIQELKEASNIIFETTEVNQRLSYYMQLQNKWDSRLRLTRQNFNDREKILDSRRMIIGQLILIADDATIKDALTKHLGCMWLQSAKLARKAGQLQIAYNSILKAETLGPEGLFLEHARLLFDMGEVKQAMGELNGSTISLQLKQRCTSPTASEVADMASDMPVDSSRPVKKLLSREDYEIKAKLLHGSWLDKAGTATSEEIRELLKSLTQLSPKSEKAWFQLGKIFLRQYEEEKTKFQRICDMLETSEKNERRFFEEQKVNVYMKMSEHLAAFIKSFSKCLQCGTKFIYEILPRLLTHWLDFTTPNADEKKKTSLSLIREQAIIAMNNYCAVIPKKVPAYVLMTAFPQMISRISHENDSVIPILEKMIFKVLLEYPQQALWQLISVSKSSHHVRSTRCREIIGLLKSNPEISDLSRHAITFADQLLNLSNFPAPSKGTAPKVLSISSEFSVLRRLAPIPLIVPLQSSMTVSLPEKGGLQEEHVKNHQAFSHDLPTIKGFQDEVEVMNSLAQPKKIGIIGSDGKLYNFLAKPKDDLRKDCRVIEFYAMINKLLRRDADGRRRDLYIRTYSVIPLSEECGLIEWVPNTNTFRNILNKLYKSRGLQFSAATLKAWKDVASADPNRLPTYFVSELLKPHQPAMFHQWFNETFTDPSVWFSSRLRFTRTAAVMSIVGFIVGLGDRHVENILVDESNGDVVHVDFNCLFDKGLSLDFPERVPFRLTHNMIDGFGIGGVDGAFSKCCEITLNQLRTNKDTLMSVLESFVHDPLVEWAKRSSKSASSSTAKRANPRNFGKLVLDSIQQKLEGGMGWTCEYNALLKTQERGSAAMKALVVMASGSDPGNRSTPVYSNMTTEAQVRELVKQATETDHLSRMWIGWSAYL